MGMLEFHGNEYLVFNSHQKKELFHSKTKIIYVEIIIYLILLPPVSYIDS